MTDQRLKRKRKKEKSTPPHTHTHPSIHQWRTHILFLPHYPTNNLHQIRRPFFLPKQLFKSEHTSPTYLHQFNPHASLSTLSDPNIIHLLLYTTITSHGGITSLHQKKKTTPSLSIPSVLMYQSFTLSPTGLYIMYLRAFGGGSA